MALSAEDFERHVKNVLLMNLQAVLDQTAATYLANDREDGLADQDGSWVSDHMHVPAAENVYAGGCDVRVRWPCIEVAVPDIAYENFALGQQDADAFLNLVLVVWLKDARFAVLERAAKRYSAAVVQVLQQPGALGDAAIQRVRLAWRTDPENPDSTQRIESGGLLFLTLDTGLSRA